MNLAEFSALKVGDKINNAMSNSEGTVTKLLPSGIELRWGEAAAPVVFTYTVNSTAWFHWSRVHMCPDNVTRCRQIGGCIGDCVAVELAKGAA